MFNFAPSGTTDALRKVKFVENKPPDLKLVSELLSECEAVNQWANFGPLYSRLADEYAQYMGLGLDLSLTPCANGGVALELLARGLAAEQGVSKLRWVGSAFSFKNLGRGYFSDMQLLDCDSSGLLSFSDLQRLDLDSFDGIVVTNPFGLCTEFDQFIRFAKSRGKKLLIDNAAGLGRKIPDWPWQSFSLHQTKPHGMGEGGLALSPSFAKDQLRRLINYDTAPADPAHWMNNGKISDIACAFQLARLRRVKHWETGYLEQRERVALLFSNFGVNPLLRYEMSALTNGLPMLFPTPVDDEKLAGPRAIDVARQYAPLAPRPYADDIYSRLVVFPTHPDLRHVSDADITNDIERLLSCCRAQ